MSDDAPTRRKRWRKVLAVIGALIATFAMVVLVDGWAAFGKAPEGERLARMEQSPEWDADGEVFENPEPLWNDWWGMISEAASADENGSPSSPLPVETVDPERYATAPPTGLRVTWLGHSTMLIELEGVGTQDIYDNGDFDDFGDDQRLDFGDTLEDYHWEYWVEEVEFALSADVMGFMGDMMGGDDGSGAVPGGGAGGAGGAMAGADPGVQEALMSQLGLGQDQLTDQLGQFIRRVRVRVWWGDDSKEAEERGREIVLTTHIISPEGAFSTMGGDLANPGGVGGAGGAGAAGGLPGGGLPGGAGGLGFPGGGAIGGGFGGGGNAGGGRR